MAEVICLGSFNAKFVGLIGHVLDASEYQVMQPTRFKYRCVQPIDPAWQNSPEAIGGIVALYARDCRSGPDILRIIDELIAEGVAKNQIKPYWGIRLCDCLWKWLEAGLAEPDWDRYEEATVFYCTRVAYMERRGYSFFS